MKKFEDLIYTIGALQMCWHLPPLTTKTKQIKSIG